MPRIVLVTGMAGAGRTTALRALEDVGFEAVDNPPIDLLDSLLRPSDETRRPLAIGIDCRAHAFDSQGLNRRLDDLLGDTHRHLRVLFLDCEEEILRRRFTETRRRHPLAQDRRVTDGIADERVLMAPLRERADVVIDTSQLSPGDLRRIVVGHFGETTGGQLTVSVLSFAYRNGLPREADLVFDVRFLANPHYVDALRPRTGKDRAVRAYVESDPNYAVLTDGLPAVEAACAEALREGVHSADVILNILSRRRDPGPPTTIMTPEALRLRHEPAADCARYDSLRRASG